MTRNKEITNLIIQLKEIKVEERESFKKSVLYKFHSWTVWFLRDIFFIKQFVLLKKNNYDFSPWSFRALLFVKYNIKYLADSDFELTLFLRAPPRPDNSFDFILLLRFNSEFSYYLSKFCNA